MKVATLVSEVRRQGIRLTRDKSDLRVFDPRGAAGSELLDALRLHKPAILKQLDAEQVAEDHMLVAALKHRDAVLGAQRRARDTCHACHGTDFWESRWRDHICGTCHPPAPDAKALR